MIDKTQTPNWLQVIDINIAHGSKQQRLDLLAKILATADRILLARYLIELMVAEDKRDIMNGDLDFLDTVLRGDGWTGYSNFSVEQNIIEFIERESTHKLFFDSENKQFQHLLAQLKNENFASE